MKVKLIIISIVLLLVMVFACGCIPFMEKIGLINPANEEQLSPEKGGPPDGLVKVLIGFKEKPGAAEQALVKGLGGKIKYTYNIIPAIAASIPEVAIEALEKNPNITNVELDSKVFALGQTLPWGELIINILTLMIIIMVAGILSIMMVIQWMIMDMVHMWPV
jgi:hypothetical protein